MEGKKKRCFVVGPIGTAGSETRNQADMLLAYIIRPALEELDYTVDRADDEKSPGNISDHVINSVLDADLVVADLTGPNANAFYELGIRHREEKPVVHMILDGQTPPFDVSNFNTIFYKLDNPSHHKLAVKQLREHVLSTQMDDFKVSNPITAARGHQQLAQSADPLQQTVSSLVKEVAELKKVAAMIADVPDYHYLPGMFPNSYSSAGRLSKLLIEARREYVKNKDVGSYMRSLLGRKASVGEINEFLNDGGHLPPELTVGDVEEIINELTKDK